jgi:four helix bundle protein
MKHAESFKDLLVYQKAREVAKEVFKITQSFPKEEMYSLTDQVRRSSRSIGAQIAEAWGKRRYEKHFISKLTDADAEQLETQHWIEVAEDCNYVVHAQVLQIINKLSEIGRMLNSMMKKAKQFCGKVTDH